MRAELNIIANRSARSLHTPRPVLASAAALLVGLAIVVVFAPSASADLRMLKDINPGPESSSPHVFTAIGNDVWFVATQPDSGTELWRTDSSPEGTVLAVEVVPGPGSPYSVSWIRRSANGRILFPASVGPLNNGLWSTDGTQAGTGSVAPLATSSFPSALSIVAGRVLMTAQVSSINNRGIWVSDGTTAGTTLLRAISGEPFCCISGAYATESLGGWVAFNFYTLNEGNELWRTDGTSFNTTLLKDLNPGGFWGTPSGFTRAIGGFSYFVGRDGSAETGRTLWRTDGTPAGTTPVKVLSAGTINGPVASRTGTTPRLYFVVQDGQAQSLWTSDGTPDGTVMVKDGFVRDNSDVGGLGLIGVDDTGRAFLSYNPDFDPEYQLWISDATALGTRPLATFSEYIVGEAIGRALIFSTSDADHGRELWISDGSTTGTHLLADINPGPGPSDPAIYPLGDRLWIRADDGAHGAEPWILDPPGLGDCNTNGTRDDAEIAAGTLHDANHDLRPDECQCLGDWDGSGGGPSVEDIFAYLRAYFADDADANHDGTTSVQDVFTFLFYYFNGCA